MSEIGNLAHRVIVPCENGERSLFFLLFHPCRASYFFVPLFQHGGKQIIERLIVAPHLNIAITLLTIIIGIFIGIRIEMAQD